MLGKLASLKDSASQNLKDLAKDAISEAKDALREGQALARAAAKSREQNSDISWDVGGFSVAGTSGTNDKSGKADAEDALNDASEVEELLAQLKKSANAPVALEEEDELQDTGKIDDEAETIEERQKGEKNEDNLKKAGKNQTNRTASKKKGQLPAPLAPEKATLSPYETASPAPAVAKEPSGGGSLHALVPQLEARLQALQAKIMSLEESREDLAASKAKSEEELRETRIAIELVTVDKQKMASQLEQQKKKLAAAEKLAKEKEDALKAEKIRVAELTDKVVESKTASSKEQEDVATKWTAKVTTLTTEIEKLKSELENAISLAQEAQKAQKIAENARIEAERKEFEAEQRAIAAINEATQLRATSSQAQDQSEQLIRDNERRSKTFNAAVEAQVQRFKASLEEQRDIALARVEEAQKENVDLEQRIIEISAALQKAKESAEEHAAAVLVGKSRVEEYEQVVATMQGQLAAAVKASEIAEGQNKDREVQREQEIAFLKNKLVTLEQELKIAIDKSQHAEVSVQTVRTEAEQWRAAAQQLEEVQVAEAAARKDAEVAIAEATALKIQVVQLQRELNDDSGNDKVSLPSLGGEGGSTSDFAHATPPRPGSTSKTKNDSILPGSRPFRRESSSNGLSGFDLESLRRTPLLTGQHRGGLETKQRSSTMSIAGSSKQLVWIYMALVHLLLLIAMGRASHAHLACEHLHLGAEGGLP